MWLAGPHLRRLWTAMGAVTVGLIVSYLYSLSSRQPLPDQHIVANLLSYHWQSFGITIVALAIASIFAERAYRAS
jgi:heme exporter protein D